MNGLSTSLAVDERFYMRDVGKEVYGKQYGGSDMDICTVRDKYVRWKMGG